jgi:hypothetical protein
MPALFEALQIPTSEIGLLMTPTAPLPMAKFQQTVARERVLSRLAQAT